MEDVTREMLMVYAVFVGVMCLAKLVSSGPPRKWLVARKISAARYLKDKRERRHHLVESEMRPPSLRAHRNGKK